MEASGGWYGAGGPGGRVRQSLCSRSCGVEKRAEPTGQDGRSCSVGVIVRALAAFVRPTSITTLNYLMFWMTFVMQTLNIIVITVIVCPFGGGLQ